MLQVIIRKRTGAIYEGSAISISSLNPRGPFDILSKHTNFVSVISREVRIARYAGDRTPMVIPLQRGLLRVHDDCVEVFVDY